MARAKRSAETSEEMRRRLIGAARGMIERRGLSSVTARALAAELGWSVGTIYTVCPSIDAITLEANAEELAALSEALLRRRDALEAEGAAPQAMIRAFAEVYLGFATARPRNWAAIFERNAEGEPPDWYRARQIRLFAILAQALQPLARSASEARRAARTLWAALHGLIQLSIAGHLARVSQGPAPPKGAAAPATPGEERPQDDLAAHAAELLDIYLTGLMARRRD